MLKFKTQGLNLILLLFLSLSAFGQDILTRFEGLVHPTTGDLNWSRPIVNIKSENGRTYPISINYNAEIKTNQPASWVGLGWGLEVGEISRSINGFPDDHKDFEQVETTYKSSGNEVESTFGWGPMYFENYSNGTDHTQDVIFSHFKRGANPALTPSFDNFYLSSGINSGSFKLENYQRLSNDITFKAYESEGTTFTPEAPGLANNFNFNCFQLENDPLRNTYIIYYTNNQIVAMDQNSQTGFVEYYDENGVAFDRSGLPGNGEEIGAFTVVNTDGTKMHYSLPVYQKNFKSISLDISQNGNLVNSGGETRVLEMSTDVVVAWKLTAITGQDFAHVSGSSNSDIMNNRRIDPEDKGYWLKFYYGKWFDTKSKTPEYDFINNQGVQENFNEQFPMEMKATVTIHEKENYYIDKIESDREVLVFFKSFRDDEFSQSTDQNVTKKIPALKISRIVKYYKQGLNLTKNNSVPTPVNFINLNLNIYSTFKDGLYFENDFSATFNSYVLGGVSFLYDYSLQPYYYKNIQNYSTTHNNLGNKINLPNYSGEDIFNVPSISGFQNSEGKLTLTNIQNHEAENLIMFDDFEFSYSSANRNPNYGANDFNMTGNYKIMNNRRSLRNENNLTENSIPDYWKLKKIKTPDGIIVEFLYELDQYSKSFTGFNGREIIVPIKDLVIRPNSWHVFGINDLAFEITMYNATDKALITSKPNRSIKFVADGVIGCQYVPYVFDLVGAVSYGENGAIESSNYSRAINSDPLKLSLGLEPRGRVTGVDQSDCLHGLDVNISAPFEHGYFIIRDENYFPGTHRVKKIKVFEDDQSSQYFSLNFSYSDGYATTNQTGISLINGVVNYGNRNTSLNSLPFNVIYSEFEMVKTGLNNQNFYRKKQIHKIVHPFATKSSASNVKDGKCYIPPNLMNASVRSLWSFMNSDDYVSGEGLPDLVESGVNYYIKNGLIGIGNNLTQNDFDNWEIIDAFIRPGTMRDFGIVRIDGNHEAIYCPGEVGLACGIDYMNNNTTNVTGSLAHHYPIYTSNLGNDRTLKFELIDLSQQLGRVEKMQIFDGKNNLVSEVDYEYQTLATVENQYKAHVEISSISETTYETSTKKYYYYPIRKLLFTKGLRHEEEIKEMCLRTGMPKRVLFSDPTYGVTMKENEYLYDHSTFPNANKIAQTGIGYFENPTDVWPWNVHRVSWLPNKTYDTEILNISGSPNTIGLVSVTRTRVFGNQLGHKLHSGTSDLDELTASSLTSQYDGLIVRKYSPTFYTNEIINEVVAFFEPSVGQSVLTHNNAILNSSQNTMLNLKGNVLENLEQVSGVYSSNRFYKNGYWPLVKASNCRYGSFTASGFEDSETGSTFFEGDVEGASNKYSPESNDIGKAHTGDYVIRLNNASNPFVFKSNTEGNHSGVLESGRTYLTSIWVNNAQISGAPTLSVNLKGTMDGNAFNQTWTRSVNHIDNRVIGDWTLIEIEFAIPELYSSIFSFNEAGTPGLAIYITGLGTNYSYLDDFRFHPIEMPLNVQIWDKKYSRISYQLDGLNQFLKFEYDPAGRVVRKIRESIHGIYTVEEITFND